MQCKKIHRHQAERKLSTGIPCTQKSVKSLVNRLLEIYTDVFADEMM